MTVVAPRFDPATIARALLDGPLSPPWRLRVTDQPRGPHRTLFAMRLQHEEGDGPAAFVQWHLPDQRLGQREGIDVLLIGTAQHVRAAMERLSDRLDLYRWESAPSTLGSGEQWL